MEQYKKINYRTAVDFLLPRHYSGRVPVVSYAYGLYNEGELMAVCTFGTPATPALCKGIAGEEYRKKVLELNRLCRVDEYNGQLSQFVGWCLKQLKPLNVIVVSYSDTDMNHHGYIYQACNFLYTGMTKRRTDKYTEGIMTTVSRTAYARCVVPNIDTFTCAVINVLREICWHT